MRRKLATYHYDRPGIAMLTLKARPGVFLCRITPETFTLSSVGTIVEQDLRNIPSYYPQLGIDEFQIMPDHLHVIVHTYETLPSGSTLQTILRGFKIGVNRKCREAGMDIRVFEDGFYDQIILDEEHLKRERTYIRDNVRRLRMKRANPELFTRASAIHAAALPPGVPFQGIGNLFLLDRPLKAQIQFSRSTTEEQWRMAEREILRKIELGYVFVSPFISPCEKRAFDLVLEHGGSCIHLITTQIGPRYKPAGRYFDLCAQGRLLELRAGTKSPHAGATRVPTQWAHAGAGAHLSLATKWPDWRYLNALCAQIANECPPSGHSQVSQPPPAAPPSPASGH